MSEKTKDMAEAQATTSNATDLEEENRFLNSIAYWDEDYYPRGRQHANNSTLLTATGPSSMDSALANYESDGPGSSLPSTSNASDLTSSLRDAKGKQREENVLQAQPDNNDYHPKGSESIESNFEWDEDPPERPHWLTGRPKPLPHPDLTAEENEDNVTCFWTEDIERLQQHRLELAIPPPRCASG
ncbi:Nn.00g062280.m01.CDS01 [Neocucurbitaria sp. VM-36]